MSIETLNQARPKESLTGHAHVLIVGAGISGIGLGHYLVTTQPQRTFAIVDSRDAIGGTWNRSATRASGRTPICTLSATSSNRGPVTTPSPMRAFNCSHLFG